MEEDYTISEVKELVFDEQNVPLTVMGKKDNLGLMDHFIGIYDGFMSVEDCRRTITEFDEYERHGLGMNRQQHDGVSKHLKDDFNMFQENLLQQNINDRMRNDTGEGDMAPPLEMDMGRTFSTANFFLDQFFNRVWQDYTDRYPCLKETGVTIRHLKYQRTHIGQGYHVWHTEDMGLAYDDRCAVFMLYLNDVHEGGETEFLYYPGRITPRTGRLIIWPAGYTHVHRGNPPISNTKYVLTGWVQYSHN